MKNLKQWCLENKEYRELELYENAINKKNSDEIGYSSPKNVNWKCNKCNIQWEQSPNKMSSRTKRDCPYCMKTRASYFYNLYTECPILLTEWDNEKNKKDIKEYMPESHEKVWWKCSKGHNWEDIIRNRVKGAKTNLKSGRPICPYCNNERVSRTYNLVTEFPIIARQWNYLKNGILTPLNCSPKSNKKVYWTCEYNPEHVWQDRISNRTILNRGCPICKKEFTVSLPARVIYYYLNEQFDNCEIEYRVSGNYVVDICLVAEKIAIEYDGWYHHSSKESSIRENKKDDILKEQGFDIIRIKSQKEKINDIIKQGNIIKYHEGERKENLDKMVKVILNTIGEKTNRILDTDIDFNRDYRKIEDLYYHVRKSNTLAVKCYQPIMEEWSKENERTPDTLKMTSNYKALWNCPKCGKTYKAIIHNRVKQRPNCPKCRRKKDQDSK